MHQTSRATSKSNYSHSSKKLHTQWNLEFPWVTCRGIAWECSSSTVWCGLPAWCSGFREWLLLLLGETWAEFVFCASGVSSHTQTGPNKLVRTYIMSEQSFTDAQWLIKPPASFVFWLSSSPNFKKRQAFGTMPLVRHKRRLQMLSAHLQLNKCYLRLRHDLRDRLPSQP